MQPAPSSAERTSSYSVTASAPGFSPSKFTNVVLVIDQHMALNFKLTVGSVSASVEVNDAPPVLQSQSAEVGTVISGDAISGLPLLGRNFYDLTTLVPGVAQVGGSINSFAVSVSGQREYANSIQLDGIEATTNRTQDVTVKQNVDSVDQFKVVTAGITRNSGTPQAALSPYRRRPARIRSTATHLSFIAPPSSLPPDDSGSQYASAGADTQAKQFWRHHWRPDRQG